MTRESVLPWRPGPPRVTICALPWLRSSTSALPRRSLERPSEWSDRAIGRYGPRTRNDSEAHSDAASLYGKLIRHGFDEQDAYDVFTGWCVGRCQVPREELDRIADDIARREAQRIRWRDVT
jgi:hypothetical protein